MKIILIVAIDKDWRIGTAGTLPWDCPIDKKYFRNITFSADANKKNVLIMGRKTFEDCGILKGRLNVIITRTKNFVENIPDVLCFTSLKKAITELASDNSVGKIFICGGREIYREAIEEGYCDSALVSRIGDTYVKEHLSSVTRTDVKEHNSSIIRNNVYFPKKEFLQHFLETTAFNATLDFQVVEFKRIDVL